jgi:hypothetical protein
MNFFKHIVAFVSLYPFSLPRKNENYLLEFHKLFSKQTKIVISLEQGFELVEQVRGST